MSQRNQRFNSTNRRGGVLFGASSNYQLQTVKYAEAQHGILKVSSLEESLLSCTPLPEDRQRAPSLKLESLRSSLRNVLWGISLSPQPGCAVSHGTGTDLLQDSKLNTSITSHTYSTSEQMSGLMDQEKRVQFSDISIRLYPVAPSDHPGASGKGPAIALKGWRYTTPPMGDIPVDAYEATRPHRRCMEDLKLDIMERRTLLVEHGASRSEMSDFQRRVKKARAQRAESVQTLTMYGRHHEERLERREKVGRFLQRAFRVRKTNSKTQASLWDKAQQQQ